VAQASDTSLREQINVHRGVYELCLRSVGEPRLQEIQDEVKITPV